MTVFKVRKPDELHDYYLSTLLKDEAASSPYSETFLHLSYIHTYTI